MDKCMNDLDKADRATITTGEDGDIETCEGRAKIKAADKLGKKCTKEICDFDAEDLISIKEKGAQKKSAKTRGDCVSKIDELIEDADRVTAETKCDTEAETAFKNVKGFTTGTFDSVKFEKERVEGAADQMAKGMEVCHQEAEAAAKTCHTAISDSESTAGVTAKKACETALDTAVTACDARGQEEFKKLTGKTIDRDEVKKNERPCRRKSGRCIGKNLFS